jgi:hypothetical protein
MASPSLIWAYLILIAGKNEEKAMMNDKIIRYIT